MPATLDDVPQGHYGAILVDPPWRFEVWKEGSGRNVSAKYNTMTTAEIMRLPVRDLAAPNCALFLWMVWPRLPDALRVIDAWGFVYKTCAFSWIKAHAGQLEMFRDDGDTLMGSGFWTRANSEACLLATRGRPRRQSMAVRQAIIEPRREHSRKPDCVYERIERLIAGPYLELFARQRRSGWDCWGDEVGKFAANGFAAHEQLALALPA